MVDKDQYEKIVDRGSYEKTPYCWQEVSVGEMMSYDKIKIKSLKVCRARVYVLN